MRWKYLVHDIYETHNTELKYLPTDSKMETTLNIMGERGWELVSANWERVTMYKTLVYRTIWKKPQGEK